MNRIVHFISLSLATSACASAQCPRYSIQSLPIPCNPGYVSVSGVNSQGTVIGEYGCVGFSEHPFYWNGGSITPIQLPPNKTDGSAVAINDAGEIIGWMSNETTGGPLRAFVFK